MHKFIDGKAIANKTLIEIKNRVEVLKEANKGSVPALAIVKVETGIGDFDNASRKYINNKLKAAEKCGIETELHDLPFKTTEKKLAALIKKLNKDKKIHGIIVQLPLPDHISEKVVSDLISPEKDVDGFSAVNLGLTMLGEDSLAPCTPAGILKMLKETEETLVGKNIAVVGRSNIVGKPMVNMLINEGATVTCCNSKTKMLKNITKKSDIVIVATGQAKKFNQKYFKHGQTIIDVGINFDKNGKLCGDVDFDSTCRNLKNLKITPVPGGVGPMTVAMLMSNVLKTFEKTVDNNENPTKRK